MTKTTDFVSTKEFDKYKKSVQKQIDKLLKTIDKSLKKAVKSKSDSV
jgi:hypothetical protein